MKLALKVILATTLGMLAVLVGFGYVRTRGQIELLDADMKRDHKLIATTLGLCVARTWARMGPERALELVAEADAERPGLRIAWIELNGNPRPGSTGPRFPTVRPEDLNHVTQVAAADPEQPDQTFLVTRVPVTDKGQVFGAIEIAESHAAREADIRASISNTVIATLVMFGIAGLITVVFGVWLVGRPLSLLAEKARRVGEGALSEPLRLSQRDEIGELAGEMNAMCERLADAQSRTEAEASAKIRALEQLRHADRLITVGRLAAGIAHELGTPLTVIAGRTKMLRRADVAPNLAQDYLAVISDQADHMASIIRQLLDFARRREPKRSRADLFGVTTSIVRLMEPTARKRGVTLVPSSSEPVFAAVDPMQLEQVLSNLIVNAIHASTEGGSVEISAGITNRASADTEQTAQVAYVRIRDHGHGMAPEIVARVFEPFFTTKDVGQGTGLGLSVAHGIVEEHGGSIRVESEVGTGSTFTVYLPVLLS